MDEQVLTAEGGGLLARERSGLLNHDQAARLLWLKADVATLPISFDRVRDHDALYVAGHVLDQEGPALLVIDSIGLEQARHTVPDLKRLAESSLTWVVVVVAEQGQCGSAVEVELSEHRDALVWVERPDLDDPDSDRCGEAELFVYGHGARMSFDIVAFQEQYLRFINVGRQPFYGGADTH